MQARCPYCSSVFEADRPGIRFCPSCGKQIQIPDVSASAPPSGSQPPPGPTPASTSGATGAPVAFPPPSGPTVRGPTPWERRQELGPLKGLIETWRQTIFTPEPFWSSVKPDGPPGDAVGYAWILWFAAAVIRFPITAIQSVQSQELLRHFAEQLKNLPPEAQKWLDMISSFETHPVRSALMSSGYYLLAPLWLLIASAIVHLFCMLFGCSKNGYWATFRVFAYASAPVVAAGIPCVGFLANVYMVVLQIWGISKVQETSIGKAAGVVLGPVVLLFCCGCLAIMGLGALGVSLLRQ